jgi:hypothetical protein
VRFYNSDVGAGPYEFDQNWYDPSRHYANFVVVMNPPVPLDPIAPWQVHNRFGPPTHVYEFGPYVILTYDTNLLTDLSPSLPPPPQPGATPTPSTTPTPAAQLYPTATPARTANPSPSPSGTSTSTGTGELSPSATPTSTP